MRAQEVLSQDLVDHLDGETRALYLEVPGENVVLLQGFFEMYECLGIVRTLSIRKSLVALLTTPDMLSDCMKLLECIQAQISWKAVPRPDEAVEQLILGYFRGASAC